MPTQSAQTASKPFGPACSAVPSSGAGSFSGMSTAPVATAASNNPALSTLVTAVKKASLVDTLNSAKGITVFAPANSAFAKIPSATLSKVLANKAELTKILTYHVVGWTVTTGDFASGMSEKTLEGATVTLAKMGSTYTVNGAKVVCGGVHRQRHRLHHQLRAHAEVLTRTESSLRETAHSGCGPAGAGAGRGLNGRWVRAAGGRGGGPPAGGSGGGPPGPWPGGSGGGPPPPWPRRNWATATEIASSAAP